MLNAIACLLWLIVPGRLI